MCLHFVSAKSSFCSKFTDKTKNQWSNRGNFVSYNGKYTLLERDYSIDDDNNGNNTGSASHGDDDSKEEVDIPPSKLDTRIQDLIRLICDLDMMKQQMIEIGYDANKLPLGKLSKEHIKKGYAVLQQISLVINNGTKNHNRLIELSNEFYTLIPHDFGKHTMHT